MKAWMSLYVSQIPPLTTDLSVFEHLKNRCHHSFSVAINLILFKFAGNEDMNKILDEFEFQPIWTTNYQLAALEHWKKSFRLTFGKTTSSRFLSCF